MICRGTEAGVKVLRARSSAGKRGFYSRPGSATLWLSGECHSVHLVSDLHLDWGGLRAVESLNRYRKELPVPVFPVLGLVFVDSLLQECGVSRLQAGLDGMLQILSSRKDLLEFLIRDASGRVVACDVALFGESQNLRIVLLSTPMVYSSVSIVRM